MAIQPSPRRQIQMPATVPTQEPAQLGMTLRIKAYDSSGDPGAHAHLGANLRLNGADGVNGD